MIHILVPRQQFAAGESFLWVLCIHVFVICMFVGGSDFRVDWFLFQQGIARLGDSFIYLLFILFNFTERALFLSHWVI